MSIHMRAIKPTKDWELRIGRRPDLVVATLSDLGVSDEWIGRYFGVEIDAITALRSEHGIVRRQFEIRQNCGPDADVAIPPLGLPGNLAVPARPNGLVIFAHGSGSSRSSPRNAYVAEAFNEAGFATLLFDLLMPEEEADRRNVFDISLLAGRLVAAVKWSTAQANLSELPFGLFGASTGAAAALVAAAQLQDTVRAVVSRGGRPDLADRALEHVCAPTLLIVGGRDRDVISLNESALARLRCPKALKVIPGATHLFPEPSALDSVIIEAKEWFKTHFERSSARD
jgi:putative phosphoribosyl transferase